MSAATGRRPVGLARHEDGGCRVCRHDQREAIEAAYVAWKTLREIEAEFTVPKDSVARHARARGLDERRSRNVRGVLVRIVEKGIETAEVTSAALVAAATALAKMGEDGRLTDRIEVSAQLGTRGWELVSAVPFTYGGLSEAKTDAVLTFFKRTAERMLPA